MNYIKFRDLQGNLVYFRRDMIAAIVIISPLCQDNNAKCFINCGVTASQVSPDTANAVLKELEFFTKES